MNTSMKEALATLEIKSARALGEARQELLRSKVENRKFRQALEYYSRNWDDTLHPGMIALACEAIGGSEQDSLLMQVPMLFLTAAIDIHDDIIDNSRVKNGKYTVFGKFGKELALLAGDGMLLRGMTICNMCRNKILPETMDAIVSTIEIAFTEAGDAHTLETIFNQRMNPNPERYFGILKKKASILEAHARIGGIVGRGTASQIESLGEYGRIVGMLITLRDEFIDIFDVQELTDRIRSGCLPLPLMYAFRNLAEKQRISEILSKPKISERDAEVVFDVVSRNKKVKSLRRKMKLLSDRALHVVSGFRVKQPLECLAVAALEDI